jgi:uncharacterized protein
MAAVSTDHPISITGLQARHFLLMHQGLFPPRSLKDKSEILGFFRRVGCVQYDPVNIVGYNSDLALQARVQSYRPRFLDELLYQDRLLKDGWDKVSSIYPMEDFPYFARHRALMVKQHGAPDNPPMKIAGEILDAIRARGALSSLDLAHPEQIKWDWGFPTNLARAALEVLYAMGTLGIHHRVGTRRYFDLNERLIPAPILAFLDPNLSEEDYQDWHVLRRIGGLGMADPNRWSDYWLGILRVKTQARQAALRRLLEAGKVLSVTVEDNPKRTYFIRSIDFPTLESALNAPPILPQACFLPPLDNLLWDRKLLRTIFDFNYSWEVYKPASKLIYGHYVLPVLYGDRFIARFEPLCAKKSGVFTINNWWWEEGVSLDKDMQTALIVCMQEFAHYLNTDEIKIGTAIADSADLQWLSKV